MFDMVYFVARVQFSLWGLLYSHVGNNALVILKKYLIHSYETLR